MCDHNYALWRWNPLVATAVEHKWLGEVLGSVEIKDPSMPDSDFIRENSLNTPDILKEMEAIASGEIVTQDWIDPVPLDIP